MTAFYVSVVRTLVLKVLRRKSLTLLCRETETLQS